VIVTCEACDTRFQLDDERIPSEGVRVRCSCCRHGFFVSPAAGDESWTGAVDAPEKEGETGRALSDHFDRAVEEDRAEVLARETPSPLAEHSDVGADPLGFNSASSVPTAAAPESSDPVEAEGPLDLPVERPPPSRPISPISRGRASDAKDSAGPPVAHSSLWRVPRPPRLGSAATVVGWTLTLGLCALGLLWEIRATVGG